MATLTRYLSCFRSSGHIYQNPQQIPADPSNVRVGRRSSVRVAIDPTQQEPGQTVNLPNPPRVHGHSGFRDSQRRIMPDVLDSVVTVENVTVNLIPLPIETVDTLNLRELFSKEPRDIATVLRSVLDSVDAAKTFVRNLLSFMADNTDDSAVPKMKKAIKNFVFNQKLDTKYHFADALIQEPDMRNGLVRNGIHLNQDVRKAIKSNLSDYHDGMETFLNLSSSVFLSQTEIRDDIKTCILDDNIEALSQDLYYKLEFSLSGDNESDIFRIAMKNIKGYCELLTSDQKSLIDAIVLGVENLSEQHKTSFHRIVKQNLNFKEGTRASELSKLNKKIQIRRRAYTQGTQSLSIVKDAFLGRIDSMHDYDNVVNQTNVAEKMKPLYEIYRLSLECRRNQFDAQDRLGLEDLDDNIETLDSVLDYMRDYQETTNKIESLRSPGVNPHDVVAGVVDDIFDNLLNRKYIGFPHGWAEHSTSVQLALRDSDIVFREFNSGDRSDSYLMVERTRNEEGGKKVRGVQEYVFNEFHPANSDSVDKVKHFLKLLVMNNYTSTYSKDKNQDVTSNPDEMASYGFRRLDPNYVRSPLGAFVCDYQTVGNCLINSLKIHLRGVMILQEGVYHGHALYEEMDAFLRTTKWHTNFRQSQRHLVSSVRMNEGEVNEALTRDNPPIQIRKPSVSS